MTKQKHLKRRVRSRMEKTGESYTTARRRVTGEASPTDSFIHFSGRVPAAAALRILLANQEIIAPHTGVPFSEAMVFGIAGGIGAGVFAFHYQEERVSTFLVAGRHLWQDDLTYLVGSFSPIGRRGEGRGKQRAREGCPAAQRNG